MTAASGLAQNFTHLALARVGVGVGEAACSPPAHSLLADYFPPERRATAFSVYNCGTSVGILFGMVAGGWISELFGWRWALFMRWYLWFPAISGVLSIPLVIGFVMLDSMAWGLVIYVPAVILTGMWLAAAIAATQMLVKLRMRATGSAILFLVMNLIGMGMGPQAVGVLNDLLFDRFGDDAIRYSLLLVKSITIWSAIHFTLAARALRADMLVKNG